MAGTVRDTRPSTRKGKRIGRPPIHGFYGTFTYRAWTRMKSGCNKPGSLLWHATGAKGIGYDVRWEAFEAFLADMGPAPDGHGLRRLDPSDDYRKDNCAWVPSPGYAKGKTDDQEREDGPAGG